MKVATLALITRTDQMGRLQVLLGLKNGAEIGSGLLNGPGGKLEEADRGSKVVCVIRETQEEVDIALAREPLEYDGPIVILTCFAAGEPDFEVHVFRTTDFFGEPQRTSSMSPGWYPADNLPFDRMHDGDKYWFARALASAEPFRANLYYSGRGEGFERIEFHPF